MAYERLQVGDAHLREKVYLERVQQYFGHAYGNVIGAAIAIAIIRYVLNDAGVPERNQLWWMTITGLFLLMVPIIEFRFRTAKVTIHTATRWVLSRMFCGGMVIVMFGLSPLLFSDSVSLLHEMLIFILLMAFITVSALSYAVMPSYTVVLTLGTMTPITVRFLMQDSPMHTLLVFISVVIQAFVVVKAFQVSRSAISAIRLNQQLMDEVQSHKHTQDQLEHIATHDMLTGLPNRQQLMRRLSEIIDSAEETGHQVAVLFLDLDGFKAVNDAYGHDAGDTLLREMASRLRSVMRSNDLVARVGGDEFVLVSQVEEPIESKPNDQIKSIAARIVSVVEQPVSLPDHKTGQVSASIGIALYPDDSRDLQDLIRFSDNAMYAVKKSGKNSFQFVTTR